MKKVIYAAIFIFSIVTSICHAEITLEINKGVDKPFPVAIVAFSNDAAKEINHIVTADLANSGRFYLLDHSEFPDDATSAQQLDLRKWERTGVEYIVTGSVIPNTQGDGKYNIRFELTSILGNHTVSGRVFKGISKKQILQVGHTISDYIYQKITGEKGYFTTKLAYIDVVDPYDIRKATYNLVISDYDGQNPQVLFSQKRIPITSPTWSPNGRELAYVSYWKGRMAIYVINVRTGIKKIVANYPGINSSPVFAPGSNVLAVALSKDKDSSVTQLYLTEPYKNGIIKKLTYSGTNTSPVFSPNGKSIAFTSTRGGKPQIYIMGINDLTAKRLTYTGSQNFDPRFTPDGKNIIFMHQPWRGGPIEIAKMDIESGKVGVLTAGPVDTSPSISPNGTMVIYTKMSENGRLGLAMVSLDGRIHIDLPSINTNANISSPTWSPFFY
jgi:TolB protein